MKIRLIGPGRYVKNIFKPYKTKSDILMSIMTDSHGNEHTLLENQISIHSEIDGKILIYHSYNESSDQCGRWYKIIDSIHFQNIQNNKLSFDIDNYEGEDGTVLGTYKFVIEFTNSGIKKFR